MNIEEWKQTMKGLPMSTRYFDNVDYKVQRGNNFFQIILTQNFKFHYKFKYDCLRNVKVTFKQVPEHITVFHASMFIYIFILHQRPYDYGSYHTCEAGKEFIENIEKIEVFWICTKKLMNN